MKRRYGDRKVTLREWRKHRRTHVESNIDHGASLLFGKKRVGLDPYIVDCQCDEQKGRFRKKDAFDCGKPHCNICHYAKYPKREKHPHEHRSEIDFAQQLKELS